MLTVLIIVMNFAITGFGIYLFDYKKDGILNDVPIIILCVILSIIITVFLVWVFLELLYLSLPKNKIHKSMFIHKIIKQIASVPFQLYRIRLEVIGLDKLPKENGFTIYSNHSSWIDPTYIMNALYNYPVAALGKESAFSIPVIGKFAPKFGFVMIIREDLRQTAKAIGTIVKRVQDGYAMVIFPEGTRNPSYDTVLDFKAGSFKVALRSKRPIVPVTLVKPPKRKWRLFTRIKIIIHEPINFDDFKMMKTKEIAKNVQNIVESSLKK